MFHTRACEEYDFEVPADDQHVVTFYSADGTRLHGLYYPAPIRNAKTPRYVILYLHGTVGNLTRFAPRLRIMRERFNASVMTFDYRGYGCSAGEPSEDGMIADARAARKWLAQEEGIQEGEIVILGRSIGGGVAIAMVAQDGAKALILQSTFTRITDVAENHLLNLPVGKVMKNKFNSIEKIAQYKGPLLQSHGQRDYLIKFKQGQELFNAANEPKEFYAFPAGHKYEPLPAEYDVKLEAFLDKYGAVQSVQR